MVLLEGSNDSRYLAKKSLELLDSIYRPGFEYKKSGVCVGQLESTHEKQLDLFDSQESSDGAIESEKLMGLMDKINNTYGKNTLALASSGVGGESWKPLGKKKSPRYTSHWGELLKVK